MKRAPVFDAVRTMLSRGFTQAEVARLDKAIDQAQGLTLPAAMADGLGLTEDPPGNSAISSEGIALIKRFEGCAKQRADGRIEAYPDPGMGGAPWTIGWGATGPGIARGTVWTQAECDARLEADLVRYAREVADAIGRAPTNQAQFDALVSFHYNTGAIARATLTAKHKAGDFTGAAAEFGKWIYAGGGVLTGLVKRRAAETALYGRAP